MYPPGFHRDPGMGRGYGAGCGLGIECGTWKHTWIHPYVSCLVWRGFQASSKEPFEENRSRLVAHQQGRLCICGPASHPTGWGGVTAGVGGSLAGAGLGIFLWKEMRPLKVDVLPQCGAGFTPPAACGHCKIQSTVPR